jgi:hypothetical protein
MREKSFPFSFSLERKVKKLTVEKNFEPWHIKLMLGTVISRYMTSYLLTVEQGSQACGPRAACGTLDAFDS